MKNSNTNADSSQNGDGLVQAKIEIERYERIVDRAHKEIEHVQSMFRWMLTCVGIIVAVGGYFWWGNMNDFEESMKIRYDQKLERERQDFSRRLNELENEVKDRIEEEFETERIRGLIHESASVHVKTELEPLLSKLDDKLQEVELKLEVQDLLVRVSNDDAEAFRELNELVQDASSPYQDLLEGAYLRLKREYESPYDLRPWPKHAWEKEPLPHFDISAFKKEYERTSATFHTSLIHVLNWSQTIAKRDKLAFYVECMEKEKSMNALSFAILFFCGETDQEIHNISLLNPEPLIQWWWENRDTIE